MHKLLLIGFLISISYCNQKNEDMKIIEYGTKEFILFEQKSKIKIQKAWNIQLDFLRKQKTNSPVAKGYPLFFSIGEDYVFSPTFYPKMDKVSLNGIYVNANTGELKYINNSKKDVLLKSISAFKGYYGE